MASVIDKLRNKTRGNAPQRDWNNTGSFINKPSRGWLHPDEHLAPDVGVCYGVRYVGCMEVKQSMKSLDFETRTAVAKESINRVSEAAGLKTSANAKKNRKSKVAKLLGAEPNLVFAGANINLTITTDSLSLLDMESGDMIAQHQMPGVSFASGGDPDTMDFVAYVAKDEVNGRACFVLECGGGLAQDVITTIGQAFELRFKQYMNSRPEATRVPSGAVGGTDAWGEDGDYYNDRPGVQPPSPKEGAVPPQYDSAANLSDGEYSSVREQAAPVAVGNLIDLNDAVYNNTSERRTNIYDNNPEQGATGGIGNGSITYDQPPSRGGSKFDNAIYDNTPKGGAGGGASAAGGAIPKDGSSSGGQFDPFDMRPFDSALAASRSREEDEDDLKKTSSNSPYHEEWFHGPLTRKQTEDLLQQDGDFLVRESTNSPGQFVLSGMHKGKIKHLLLVDPNGVVRTRDRTFNSVSHLINYHMENGLPIISQESELILKNPVVHAAC